MDDNKINKIVNNFLDNQSMNSHQMMREMKKMNLTDEEYYQVLERYGNLKNKIKSDNTNRVISNRREPESNSTGANREHKDSIMAFSAIVCFIAAFFGLNSILTISIFLISASIAGFMAPKKSRLAVGLSIITFVLIFIPAFKFYVLSIDREVMLKAESIIPAIVAFLPAWLIYSLLNRKE